ncbi:hypothetical protein EMPG_16475 [Blastomyces silverae]|uniref:Uncharacterized protein n=1 Tax=Blastomyces silverae TaxID=2060906 RepID=A0A0H1BAD8_9EURO|nr:hypothetical protein EMPG_16475 [Blastomyces silverae]
MERGNMFNGCSLEESRQSRKSNILATFSPTIINELSFNLAMHKSEWKRDNRPLGTDSG